MVSWRAASREAANPRLGRDVVLHEFAHKIDMHDGVLDGTPLLARRRRTAAVGRRCAPPTSRRSVTAVRDEFLRAYAGTNPGEFFAVATETFFTRPIELAARHTDLYEVFGDFYRQDPAARARAYAERIGALVVATTRPRIVVRRRVRSRPTRRPDRWAFS